MRFSGYFRKFQQKPITGVLQLYKNNLFADLINVAVHMSGVEKLIFLCSHLSIQHVFAERNIVALDEDQQTLERLHDLVFLVAMLPEVKIVQLCQDENKFMFPPESIHVYKYLFLLSQICQKRSIQLLPNFKYFSKPLSSKAADKYFATETK